jgi:lipopolysaccharide biosynthesis regulator YciM
VIFKILKLVIFILLIWYLSEFFANSEGETFVNWMGWGVQIPTDRFILILILFSILIIFIDRIWLAFLNFPKAAYRRYEVNNNKKVEQKLVKAFLLASHGEFESAAKEASLVAKNTKDKKLGKLLSTHLDVFKNLNENSTNKKELSKNYFKQLTAEPSTAFVGHLALIRQAISDKKNINEIIEEAEKAIKFEPKSKQILEVLLFSYAKVGDLTNSLVYLNKLKNMKYINHKIYQNIASDLNYMCALNCLEKGNVNLATNHLKEAFKQKPNHILVSIKLASLLKGIGSKTKSINQLEKTFLLTSNHDVLDELSKKWDLKTSGARVAKAINLLGKKSTKEISNDLKIAVACYAISEKIWGEAEKLLNEVPENKLTNKAYQAFADIAGSQNNPKIVKDNLEKAANADDGFNYFCSSCGNKNNKWELHCPKCDNLSTINWMKMNDIEMQDSISLPNLAPTIDKNLISY